METTQTTLSLEQVLGVLRRRWAWTALCVVLVAGAAYGFSKHQTKKYTATASLVFNENQLGQAVSGLPVTNNGSQQAQQNTNLRLVQLGDMAAKTASQLGMTKDQVSSALDVSAQAESNIVNVSATATKPELAAKIANTYVTQFVTEQQSSNHAYYTTALKQLDKQLAGLSRRERGSAAGLALQDRAQSLATLAELRSGNVQIAQAATIPTSPSSPKVARNTILGGVLGLLLGLGIAFLRERFDRQIREPQDLEAIYELPLLGVVPESAALARSARGPGSGKRRNRRGITEGALPPSEEEAFHLIRAHLRYFNVDRELRTVLVVSAAPRDGKTTVARHLARAAAAMGSVVLLVEADLRRPTLAQELDLQPGPGLADVLIGALPLWYATQMSELDAPSPNGSRSEMRPGGRSLDVLVAGAPLPPNPSELIESHAMEGLLEHAMSTYDLVVIDTPPLTAVSDAFPLLRRVDGVIVVGRVGRGRRDAAQRLHTTLAGTGAPLLGVVANGVKTGRHGSYDYAYAYTDAVSEQPAEAAAPSSDRPSSREPSLNGPSAEAPAADAPHSEAPPAEPASAEASSPEASSPEASSSNGAAALEEQERMAKW
jgi:polysaccharide biosynthesis transport protein